MKGTKKYRFEDNPKEKEFHDKFVEKFDRDHSTRKTLSAIVNGWSDIKQNEPKRYLSPREETICANIIQWLGSPVGMSFLKECGFIEDFVRECELYTSTEDLYNGDIRVTSCCGEGPIIDENYCPNCGKKIKK